MNKAEQLLSFADTLLKAKTGNELSYLQRLILIKVLEGVKASYEDIAEAHNYSPRYLRQDIAPKLWNEFSQVLACKVSKSNIRALLEREMEEQAISPMPSLQEGAPSATSALVTESERGDILLVDDQLENLTLLTHLLEEVGHIVRQAISGSVALQAIAFSPPDLVLLDINMPDMDGYTVCQHLRENTLTHDIPVIFISALDESQDKVKAFSVGGNDYITKPFKTIEVLARIQNHLKVRRLQQTLRAKEKELLAARQEIANLKSA
ncbi:MAG: response regulator [Cyanobacteria bacterium P01_C01_bin.118]